ncbi:MAG: hypothetical protein ABIK99_06400 [candidate division WOR-3 bacterium]
MEEIREETIFQAIEEIAGMEPEQFDDLVKRVEEEQPDLMNYLKEIDGEIQEEEWGFIFYNSILIWFSFTKGEGGIGLVTRQMIEEGVENNYQLLDKLWESEDLNTAITEMFQTYPQPSLLNYVANALVGDPLLREKNKVPIFVFLKTLIDCFDQSGIVLP